MVFARSGYRCAFSLNVGAIPAIQREGDLQDERFVKCAIDLWVRIRFQRDVQLSRDARQIFWRNRLPIQGVRKVHNPRQLSILQRALVEEGVFSHVEGDLLVFANQRLRSAQVGHERISAVIVPATRCVGYEPVHHIRVSDGTIGVKHAVNRFGFRDVGTPLRTLTAGGCLAFRSSISNCAKEQREQQRKGRYCNRIAHLKPEQVGCLVMPHLNHLIPCRTSP